VVHARYFLRVGMGILDTDGGACQTRPRQNAEVSVLGRFGWALPLRRSLQDVTPRAGLARQTTSSIDLDYHRRWADAQQRNWLWIRGIVRRSHGKSSVSGCWTWRRWQTRPEKAAPFLGSCHNKPHSSHASG
jgi:hypothetical protein